MSSSVSIEILSENSEDIILKISISIGQKIKDNKLPFSVYCTQEVVPYFHFIGHQIAILIKHNKSGLIFRLLIHYAMKHGVRLIDKSKMEDDEKKGKKININDYKKIFYTYSDACPPYFKLTNGIPNKYGCN